RLQTRPIYLTHHQTEATTMATRLDDMESGSKQQVRTQKENYDNPENVLDGGLIGSPAMYCLVAEVHDDQLHIGEVQVTIPEDRQNTVKEKGYHNKKIILDIRPEDIYDANDTDWSNGHNIPITVDVAELMGSETIVYGKVNNQEIVARIEARTGIETGSKMELQFDMANCHFFDPESEERIKGIKVETVAQ